MIIGIWRVQRENEKSLWNDCEKRSEKSSLVGNVESLEKSSLVGVHHWTFILERREMLKSLLVAWTDDHYWLRDLSS